MTSYTTLNMLSFESYGNTDEKTPTKRSRRKVVPWNDERNPKHWRKNKSGGKRPPKTAGRRPIPKDLVIGGVILSTVTTTASSDDEMPEFGSIVRGSSMSKDFYVDRIAVNARKRMEKRGRHINMYDLSNHEDAWKYTGRYPRTNFYR